VVVVAVTPLAELVEQQHILMELPTQVVQEQQVVEEEQEFLETEMLVLAQPLVSVALAVAEVVAQQRKQQQPQEQVAQVASLFITRSNT
jgi:hypothetical protein